MTASQYLENVYRLNELIESEKEELERLRVLSASVSSPNMSGMPFSGTRNPDPPFVRAVERIIDLERIIDADIVKYTALITEVRERIAAIENKNEKLILYNRYILFDTWETIAEKLDFTPQWVQVIHKKALSNFSDLYQSEFHDT